jgi:hypothetical protein
MLLSGLDGNLERGNEEVSEGELLVRWAAGQ